MIVQGFSLLETTVVLALIGLLGSLGTALVPGPGLAFLPGELRGALDQAFLLARARGQDVRLSLGGKAGEVRPVSLPRGLRWGLPASGVPLPPDMAAPVKAHFTGAAHPVFTVTPRGTATASAWFLTDGRDALCLRLSGQGGIQVLRWRSARRTWSHV
jgi:prepilin-type N-terminal cleavage/methylation domain-containing protein